MWCFLPNPDMEYIVKKSKEILSSKTWREPKTVIFPQLKAMHKLSTDYSSTSLIEAAGIRHNGRYPVNCVRIACIYENKTVLGSRRVFNERIFFTP